MFFTITPPWEPSKSTCSAWYWQDPGDKYSPGIPKVYKSATVYKEEQRRRQRRHKSKNDDDDDDRNHNNINLHSQNATGNIDTHAQSMVTWKHNAAVSKDTIPMLATSKTAAVAIAHFGAMLRHRYTKQCGAPPPTLERIPGLQIDTTTDVEYIYTSRQCTIRTSLENRTS